MNVTPLDINNQRFRTRFRGFDVREVDDFLQVVAGELELQLQENSRLREKAAELESRLEQLKDTVSAVKDETPPVDMEEMKASMLREAETAVEDILAARRMEADGLKMEIEHLEKTKEQLEAYFESFLRFNIDLLDTWEKRKQ